VQSHSEVRPKKRKKARDLVLGHKCIEVCQSRGNSTKYLFKYDLGSNSCVFEDDGLMKKPVKSTLCHELEKYINEMDKTSPQTWNEVNTVYLVDVMAYIRKVAVRNLHTFGDLCTAFIQMIMHICKYADRIDFIFDSYVEMSIKDSERIRRSNTKPIEISTIKDDTPLPVMMDAFFGVQEKTKPSCKNVSD